MGRRLRSYVRWAELGQHRRRRPSGRRRQPRPARSAPATAQATGHAQLRPWRRRDCQRR
jgi:hypothetical protein